MYSYSYSVMNQGCQVHRLPVGILVFMLCETSNIVVVFERAKGSHSVSGVTGSGIGTGKFLTYSFKLEIATKFFF